MSFNLNTKVNNLQAQISGIIAGSVTNPLSSTLNGNNQSITNVNTLSSVSGSPLNITAGASTVNFASEVNMVDTLTINNNTVHNGLVVKDGIGDTSCFVIDQSGNVGIKVNPSSALTTDFTVTGDTFISGNLTVGGTINASNVVNNITAGTGLIKTGTSTNPTLSNTGVLTVASGGTGISVTGTQNPVISNTGVTSIVAGTGISISGATGAVTINASAASDIVSMAYNLVPNPDATVGNALRVVPIITPSGVSLSSLGINPINYRYIEVSMGFAATTDINANYYTFYALGNDGSIGANAFGDSIYYADTSARSYYARFIMDKTAGHFTNSTTSLNMIKDDSFAPFPNGFILAFNVPFLTMMVRAYN